MQVFCPRKRQKHCGEGGKRLCRLVRNTVSNFKIDASNSPNRRVVSSNATLRAVFPAASLSFSFYFAPNRTTRFVRIFYFVDIPTRTQGAELSHSHNKEQGAKLFA